MLLGERPVSPYAARSRKVEKKDDDIRCHAGSSETT
jgi:hypothetical protein